MNLFGYLLTNLYMGIGIAADVYAATLGIFRKVADDKFRRKWVGLNTLTHTLFPLFGMYMVVTGIAVWRPLQSALFFIGAVLLGLFLRHLVREKTGIRRAKKEDGLWARLMRKIEKIDPDLALVLGVSIDALNSGFAKAADTREWPLLLLLFSFPLVGCVVGVGAWAGAQKAKWFLSFIQKQSNSFIQKQSDADITVLAQRLAKLEFWAFLVELFVLGYFFWRSVANIFIPFGVSEWVDSRVVMWGVSGVTSVIVFAFFGEEIVRNIDKEATQSFVEGREKMCGVS